MSPWPPGFRRVPAQPWTQAPVDPFARSYDGLKRHGWYANLDPTVQEVGGWLRGGGLGIDYSGGTGILAERLFAAWRLPDAGLLNADASAKFLRLAVEKLGDDRRCAFRLLDTAGGRVQTLAEAAPELPPGLAAAVVCANAIHLYPDPGPVAEGWHHLLAPGGRLHVQSGNIDRPGRAAGDWLIDGTVDALERAARELASADARFAPYRAALGDPARMAAYDALRRRYFLPVRPLEAYLGALRGAGFEVEAVRHRAVAVRRDEWARFLAVYHEGILPWVGGHPKLDGRPAPEAAVRDRLDLLGLALAQAVPARFAAEWTYVTARKPA